MLRKPVELRRDSGGRFCGKCAFPSDMSPPKTVVTPLNSVPEKLRAALEDARHALATVPAVEGRVATAICRASPGAGKSTLERHLLAERTADGDESRIFFHVPTLDLAEEAADEARALGLEAQAVRGRSASTPSGEGTMCAKAELVERANRIGISARDHFCENVDRDGSKRRCVHFAECAYLAQFQTNASHLFLASSYLTLPDPNGAVCEQRVVDETFWGQFVHIRTMSAASFTTPRTFLPLSKASEHADLLDAARKVVGALVEGRSPIALEFTAEKLRDFAKLEWEARAPEPEVFPDQSPRQQSAAVARAEHSHRQVSRFSAIWTLLADAREAELEDTERLRLLTCDNKHTIQIMRRKPLKHDQPMLVLDADADAEILRALGCDVLVTHDISLRPNAFIRQLHDRRMTIGTLLNTPTLRESWRRIITREVREDRAGQNGGVLVGATRKVVQAFFEDAGHVFDGMSTEKISAIMLETELHGAHWLWFGGRSLGSNRYKNCTSVVVIGREELPVTALEDQGAALWGDTPGEPLERIEPDHLGNRHLPEVEIPFEMTDGSRMAVQVPCHPDHRLRRVQLQTRELATRQLVERLRLARAAQPKRVLLGCNIPIPGLPVDALVSWQDLCVERVYAAVSDGLQARGGVRLSAAGLAEGAPRVFKNAHAAEDYLKRNRSIAHRLKSPRHWQMSGTFQVVKLRMSRPYSREETALLDAGSFEEARALAEQLWGPLRTCRPA